MSDKVTKLPKKESKTAISVRISQEAYDYLSTQVQGFETVAQVVDRVLFESRVDPCPHCGCDELLCGHPRECTSERGENGKD